MLLIFMPRNKAGYITFMSRKSINNKTLINKQYIFNNIIEQTEMQIICAKFHKIMLTNQAAISN